MNKSLAFMIYSIGFSWVGFSFSIGERVPFALIKKILPEKPIVIEAGAQFGEDTLWMSEMWKHGVIHAFEPNPSSYDKLSKSIANCKNVKTYNIALDKQAKKNNSFYLAGGASSLLKPTKIFNDAYFHSDLSNPIKVDSITLDEWCHLHNIKKVDFMWLDLEGNELNVLHGGKKILKTVTAIYSEVNLQRFWENCAMYSKLKSWLHKNGFCEIWRDITPNWHGNALFIRDEI